MTLKFNSVRAVVKTHVTAKVHHAECSGSIVLTEKTIYVVVVILFNVVVVVVDVVVVGASSSTHGGRCFNLHRLRAVTVDTAETSYWRHQAPGVTATASSSGLITDF